MKIKNIDQLSVSKASKLALKIAEAGLEAIDTAEVIKKNIKLKENSLHIQDKIYLLDKIKKIYVVGVGKCSYVSALELEKILGNRITDGYIIDVVCKRGLKKIRSCEGTHPYPSNKNIGATKKLISLLKKTRKNDLVIAIVSGGGSTLLCQPKSFTCQEESQVLRCMMKAGAKISEINIVRKHLSLARGGYLAKYAYPAQLAGLIFSDVIGDDLQFIASGPIARDNSRKSEAKAILKKYNIKKLCGFDSSGLLETPKEKKYFNNIKNFLLVSNKLALRAMADMARDLGLNVEDCDSYLSGEAEVVGEKIVKALRKAKKKTVLLYGGETTVTIRGAGKGGRNQELALAALRKIKVGEIILALATDGMDNGDVAGAIANKHILDLSQKKKLDIGYFLDNNNSYKFWQVVSGQIKTGYTGSNVSDLIIALKI